MNEKFPKPIIIKASQSSEIKSLIRKHPEITINDTYKEQQFELFKVRHPKKAHDHNAFSQFISKEFGTNAEKTGNWIYLPWKNTLIHLLEAPLFQMVRTARNQPLISKKDQEKFMNSCVAIVGLSVGSSIAQTIAQSGGSNTMKLADFDHLSLSNLNRIHTSIAHLGQNKTHLVAQQIYELNPYANLILYPEGLTPQNLTDFLTGFPRPDLVIDEADDLATKQFLRLATRALKIPLLMTTDNGLDSNTRVIRFDKSDSAGGMKNVPRLSFKQVSEAFKRHEPAEMSNHQKLKLIANLVGVDNVSYEMQKGSILTARGKVSGWPQVAITVFVGGSLATYAAMRVITGKNTPKKQTTFSIASHLNPDYSAKKSKKTRKKHTQKFKSFIKIKA